MRTQRRHKTLHLALTVVYILSSFSSILTYLFMTAPPAEAAWSVTVTSRLMKNDGTLFGSNASISGHQIALVCPRNNGVYMGGYTTSTATNSHTWTGIQNSVASCDAGSIAPYQITEANGYTWTRVQTSPDNKHRYPTPSNNNITIDWDYNPPAYRNCPDGSTVPWSQTCSVAPPALPTVSCDAKSYYIQSGNIGYLSLTSDPATFSGAIATSKSINAIGYHSGSQYFYGVTPDGTDQGRLWKFNAAGASQDMGLVLPATGSGNINYTAGDIGSDGYLYVIAVGGSTMYKIDVVTAGLTGTQRLVGTIDVKKGGSIYGSRVADVAFYGGYMYGFDNVSNRFVRISTTGTLEDISDAIPSIGNNPHGGAWFYNNPSGGTYYYSYDNSGSIYRIPNINNYSSSNKLSMANFSPPNARWLGAFSSSSNDSAVCPGQTAPVEDVCPNISGTQATIPAGYIKDSNGNCIIPPTPYYPWLQTDKGDVTSTQGSITGQRYGPVPFSGSPLGGKHYTTNQYNPAEAYGVVTAALGGSNFCSQNLYALASSNSDRSNCVLSNYGSTSIDTTALGTAIDTAYNKNGAGASPVNGLCNPYNTSSTGVFNSNLSLGCIDGGIQKIASNYTMPAATGLTGRGTLWIVGNLTINSNITYGGAVGTSTDLKSLPNLGIYVTGDVIIDPNVTQIDAMIVASGKISTCSTSSNVAANNCTLPLSVNGSFASIGSSIIDFGRRYYSTSINSPAEKLTLTPQSVIFPPPGFNKGDANFESQLRFNSTELQPRLK